MNSMRGGGLRRLQTEHIDISNILLIAERYNLGDLFHITMYSL